MTRFYDELQDALGDPLSLGGGSSSPRCVRVYMDGATQTLPAAATAVVRLDTAQFDTDGFFDNANDRLTVPAGLAGYYLVTGSIRFAPAETDDTLARLYVNGGNAVDFGRADNAGIYRNFAGSWLGYLNEGDYVDLRAYSAPSGCDLVAGFANTTLSMFHIGGSGNAISFAGAKVTVGSGQSIAASTNATVAFDTVVHDDTGIFDDANDQFVVAVAGHYLISGLLNLGVVNQKRTYVRIHVNDVEVTAAGGYASTTGTAYIRTDVTDVVYLDVGDTVKLIAWHDDTVARTLSSAQLRIALLGQANHTHAANADTDWHVVGAAGEPAFENGFDTYDAVNGGATYGDCAFRKDADGFVHLKGLFDGTGQSGTAHRTVFTLPVGYRPANDQILTAVCFNNMHRMDVTSLGAVIIRDHPVDQWGSLATVTFYAEA